MYSYINDRFMSVYRPVRTFQRNMPGVLEAMAPAIAYHGLRYGYNSLRQRASNYYNSLHGQALKGAFLSLTKNNNMPPARKRSLSLPLSPVTPSKKAKRSRKTRKTKKRGKKTMRKSVYVRAGTYAGKFKVNKAKKVPFNLKSIEKLGIKEVKEHYGEFQSNDVGYIGHATLAGESLLLNFMRALWKRVIVKMGLVITDANEVFAGFNGETLTMGYRQNEESGSGNLVVNYPILAGGESLNGIATYFWSAFLPIIRSNPNLVFTEAYTNGAGGSDFAPVLLRLTNGVVDIYLKSDLKIQNRTLSNTGGTSIDIVDTNPLQGYFYEGKGNGTAWTNRMFGSTPFLGSDYMGKIQILGTPFNGLTNPPHAKEFANVSKYGKVTMQPGEIKRSFLDMKKRVKLSNFVKLIFPVNNQHNRSSFGTFRFFGLEKIMQDNAEYDVKLGYELEVTTVIKITDIVDQMTSQIVELSAPA